MKSIRLPIVFSINRWARKMVPNAPDDLCKVWKYKENEQIATTETIDQLSSISLLIDRVVLMVTSVRRMSDLKEHKPKIVN